MTRRALFLLLALLAAPAAAQQRAEAVDGDSIRAGGRIVRILGIDTPELHGARCPHERQAAELARDFVQRHIADGVYVITRRAPDRYARPLARVYLRDGRDLAQLLIREGHARRYTGGRRQGWC